MQRLHEVGAAQAQRQGQVQVQVQLQLQLHLLAAAVPVAVSDIDDAEGEGQKGGGRPALAISGFFGGLALDPAGFRIEKEIFREIKKFGQG